MGLREMDTKRKKGDVCRIIGLRGLDGLRVEILRQSKVTGDFTVKLLDDAPDAPAYTTETEISLHGYQLTAPEAR